MVVVVVVNTSWMKQNHLDHRDFYCTSIKASMSEIPILETEGSEFRS